MFLQLLIKGLDQYRPVGLFPPFLQRLETHTNGNWWNRSACLWIYRVGLTYRVTAHFLAWITSAFIIKAQSHFQIISHLPRSPKVSRRPCSVYPLIYFRLILLYFLMFLNMKLMQVHSKSYREALWRQIYSSSCHLNLPHLKLYTTFSVHKKPKMFSDLLNE